jgi:deoxyribodipyrimidine photo-lyase
MSRAHVIVWFRLDLRLADNPALDAARQTDAAVVPLYIHAPEEEEPWPAGSASRWWLHHSLRALDRGLREIGSRLVLRRGPTLSVLGEIIMETGAGAVHWNRRYEPVVRSRDEALERALLQRSMEVRVFDGALLHPPGSIRKTNGQPFRLFTPFWKHCLSRSDPEEPLAAPDRLSAPRRWPKCVALGELELLPRPDWAAGLRAAWQPGENGATERLVKFMEGGFDAYSARRNEPGVAGTSRLSPHLHFGEISARQVWRHASGPAGKRSSVAGRHSRFHAELGWREFAHHLLFHFPQTAEEPLRPEFRRFPWRGNARSLRAWQKGLTGYPIVDAGMRELWATGWMHNRVRMIAASFLVKHLLISWREGARWFWDTLVDADLAQNTLNWQWTAGCGADAMPYFRVFNPLTQGERFDPQGAYVRRWCPELAKLPERWIHQPHRAPAHVLQKAGVRIGMQYPEPVVDHFIARETALEALAQIRARRSGST